MKKFLVLFLSLLMVLSVFSGAFAEDEEDDFGEILLEPKSEGVMNFLDYNMAELDSPVVIETYIQDTQSWWDGKITCYTQDHDGAYFIYNMACSEEDAAKLVPGTKIKVTGYKSEWSGEEEITDATFEFEDGEPYIAEPEDVTVYLNSSFITLFQNQLVSFTGMKVEPSKDANGNDVAFLYNWDGSGSREENSDLYFNVSVYGVPYTFTVESYLRGNDTDVYKAVEALQIGDVIDMEGFLYWYNGVNPHIISVKAHEPEAKSEGVMTYAEYAAADIDSPVVVETYIQDTQSWWDGKITCYTQDPDGAYFIYNMACSEEDAAMLAPGTKIRVTGYKSEWSGEVEITDATFEFVDTEEGFLAAPANLTPLLGKDELIDYQNQCFSMVGLTVEPSKDANGNDVAFLYNWDGSGSHDENSDLYFNVSLDGNTYTFTVESYLCDNNSDVYSQVEGLKIGDVIDVFGYLYWYNGVNPHITFTEPAELDEVE